MRKILRIARWAVVIGFALFVIAQFVRPAKTNPVAEESLAIESQAQVDPKVEAIFNRSCVDCHSNKTRWPWYSQVAPVSWFVINHVNDGRRDMNLSEWGKYDKRRQSVRLGQMCDLAKSGEMPLSSYTPLHPGSTLSADDVKVLCDWTNAERARQASK